MSELVTQLYKQGFYTAEKMKLFVKAGWITSDQYKELTGSDYTETT